MKECSLLGCARPYSAKGLCVFHYGRRVKGRPLDAPKHYRHGPKPFFDWAACGTAKQYRKHLRQKIPVCGPCRRAENRRVQDQARKRVCLPSAA